MPIISRREAAAVHRHLTDCLSQPGTNRRRNDGTRRLALSVHDVAVYGALLTYICWTTGLCYPSLRTLAAAAGCSPTTAGDCVHRLAALGWLTITPTTVRTEHGLRWVQSYELHARRLELDEDEQEEALTTRCPPLRRGVIPVRSNSGRNPLTKESESSSSLLSPAAVPALVVEPGQRLPRPKKEALQAMMREAAAAPDLLAMRRAVMQERNRMEMIRNG